MKTVFETKNAPAAIGAYSQACKVGNQLFLSGQIGMLPETGELISENVKEQLEQAIKNLQAVCIEAKTSLQNIAKLNIYLMDMGDFAIVNELVEKYFAPVYPARAAVQVAGLPKGAKIEIDAVAFCA